MFKLNIIAQLLGFFVLAVIVNQLNLPVVLVLFAILVLLLICSKTWQFLRTIKRFKWFFVVMLLIFAFNTPGEHVNNWLFPNISPTHEGLQAGALQALRIVCMLAALSLILTHNSKQQLISGFYFILSPLKYLGLTVERFAARLWLTLHYVELQNVESKSESSQHTNKQGLIKQSLINRLKNMTDLKESINEADFIAIELHVPIFGWLDYVVIVLLLSVVVKVII